jgi:hypothetical protein
VHVPLAVPQVYDRINHEIKESPRLKEAEWRAARQAMRSARATAEVTAEVAELDEFEDHLADLARRKARSQYAPAL